MDKAIDYVSVTDAIMQGPRGWSTLNKVAELLVTEAKTSDTQTMSMRAISRRLDMDASHLSRLINKKIGFVRVYNKKPNQQPIAVGVYYQIDPMYTTAHAEGHYYPKNFGPIAKALQEGASIASTVINVYEEGEKDSGRTEVVPDEFVRLLMVAAGVKQTGHIVMPTSDQSGIKAEALIPGWPDIRVENLPEIDVANLKEELAKAAFVAVNNYAYVSKVYHNKEIR